MKPGEAEDKMGNEGGPAEAAPDPREAAGQQGAGAPAGAEAAAPAEGLQGELDKARAAVAEQYDKYLRLQAEFENYKKRMLREQSEQLKYAQLPLLRDLTAVMDNLERALQHKGESADLSAVVAGVEMVAKLLAETLERHGMARVKAAGQPFDPALHQAVSVVETNNTPENHVVEEFRPGYVLHDRVVRPAMVTVSKKPSGNGMAAETPAS